MGGSRGGKGGFGPPLENLKLFYVYLDILVLTPLDKQLNPLDPIASQGKSVRLSVKYVETKKSLRTPDRIFWICACGILCLLLLCLCLTSHQQLRSYGDEATA